MLIDFCVDLGLALGGSLKLLGSLLGGFWDFLVPDGELFAGLWISSGSLSWLINVFKTQFVALCQLFIRSVDLIAQRAVRRAG